MQYTPIYKTDWKKDLEDYRPINLTLILGKMEKFILSELTWQSWRSGGGCWCHTWGHRQAEGVRGLCLPRGGQPGGEVERAFRAALELSKVWLGCKSGPSVGPPLAPQPGVLLPYQRLLYSLPTLLPLSPGLHSPQPRLLSCSRGCSQPLLPSRRAPRRLPPLPRAGEESGGAGRQRVLAKRIICLGDVTGIASHVLLIPTSLRISLTRMSCWQLGGSGLGPGGEEGEGVGVGERGVWCRSRSRGIQGKAEQSHSC
ncbi:uncharacterized protein LOC115599874 [Calypte anna]|uniref:uncharacterized protein LOC115599874 n=1 Tax=Calypte anna TaxID=9244 RepID=UPI0011C3687B|nr:uncharacterized protein LOC115599874 [Calypte anna]